MKDVVLSMAQMCSVVGDIRGNFERMRSLAESVRGRSDIICFPECSLTGYDSDNPLPLSIKMDEIWVDKISLLSEELNLNIIFGFMERERSDLFITQALSDREGGITVYRKTHLGRRERDKFVQGNYIHAIMLPEAVIGLELCWESHFPDITTKLRREGAEVILISYASPLPPGKRRDTWMKHLPARAYDNGVFVGAVNAVGDNGYGTVFGGGAMVFDPKGNILAEHFGQDDFVTTVKLSASDKDRLGSDDKMNNTDYFLHRRNDLY
jgi:predicted amidohydrolase